MKFAFRQKAARAASWVCVIAIAALSLAPVSEIEPVRRGYGAMGFGAEHIVAYCVTTCMALLGYRQRFGLLRIAFVLLAYGALLEVGQDLLALGRRGQVIDAVENAVGIAAALMLWVMPRTMLGRSRSSTETAS